MNNCIHIINAPVAIFVYNRPSHVKALIKSLQKNDEANSTELFIFSDGAKVTGDVKKDDQCRENVDKVREYLDTIDGFADIHIILREKNYGLAENIIDGVTSVINKKGKIIVLEDDLALSERFLEYMNVALTKYEGYRSVYSIAGYSYIDKKWDNDSIPNYYFLPITCSWAWATWKDKWEHFDQNPTDFEQMLSNRRIRTRFNYNNSIDYYKMLKEQMKKNIDSWAIRWHYTVFQNDGVTLYPRYSFVTNDGFDGSGIHTMGTPIGGVHSNDASSIELRLPEDIILDGHALKATQKSIRGGGKVECMCRKMIHFPLYIAKKILGRH